MQSSKVMNTNKKHSRTSPDVQFKEFSLTKQKLDQERIMSELGKPFPKKNQIKKILKKKKLKISVKMPHVKKNHYR